MSVMVPSSSVDHLTGLKYNFNNAKRRRKESGAPMPFFNRCFRTVVAHGKSYIQSSTFHGVNHVVEDGQNRHWSEPIFWLCILIAFGGGAIWTITQSYERYLANPTVITLDKSYRTWNITFPATTFCFVNKLDAEKAKNLIHRKWKASEGSNEFDYYMRFLTVIANSSYYNLAYFNEFENDKGLASEDLSALMNEVNFDVEYLRPTLFNKRRENFFKITLEMGICYSVSSLLAREFRSLTNGRMRKEHIESDVLIPTYEPEFCVYLHISCYGIVEGIPREVTVYVHSPYEVPIAATPYHTLYYGYQMELAYNQFDIKASSHVRELHPDQRRCYFFDEPPRKSMKHYSFNTCIMECRRALAMKLCGCVPHFYTRQEGQPVCTLKQLSCIHGKLPELLALSQKRNKSSEKLCTCYPSCEDASVVFDYETISKHDIIISDEMSIVATRYRWAIEKYSKTRYKRDILFGVEELLVSFGGTACFFLGGSLMSGIELMYFFTVRLIRYLKRGKTSRRG